MTDLELPYNNTRISVCRYSIYITIYECDMHEMCYCLIDDHTSRSLSSPTKNL